ncbi:MAG TPA: hypothetical protein VMS98_16210, partial [Thermoanaerobaculia bacterium]|nr:hypothetical protein [Thermoanaerobaculia bacterium]
ALASCEKALSLPLDDLVLSYCGQVYFHLDREPQARGILDRLVGGSRPSSFYVARLYDAFGDVDDALRWLERAIHERAPESCLIKIYPWSSELRATTGFQDLVRRMNFPAAAGETSVRKERL